MAQPESAWSFLEEARSQMGSSRVLVLLRDPKTGDAVLDRAHPALGTFRVRCGEGLIDQVLRMDRLVCWPGELSLPEPGFARSTGLAPRAVLGVPLRRDGRPVGALAFLDGPMGSEEKAHAIGIARKVDALLVRSGRLSPVMETEPCRTLRRDDIVGNAPALVAALDRAGRAALTDATVLITGETGTGKERLARAIHNASRRARSPLLKIDCGAIPENLIESELFGHTRGAWTGAVGERAGIFEAAAGGTVFVDEIGELSLNAQTRLLRVIEDRVLQRVGSHNAVPIDVRLVVATHRDLARSVREKSFREDLYHRIKVVPIHLPALRDRGASDILQLVDHLARHHAERHGLPLTCIPAATRDLLAQHPWPGNVRELSHAIESALVLSPDGVLSPDLFNLGTDATPAVAGFEDEPTVDVLIARYLVWLLERHHGQRATVARIAGVSRSTLWRHLKEGVAEAHVHECACSAEERATRDKMGLECCSRS